MCQSRSATVHLTENCVDLDHSDPLKISEHHFCEDCVDTHFKTTGKNACRGLIELSDRYRSRLYDELQLKNPVVFTWWTGAEARKILTEVREFLQARFKEDGIEVSGDAFEMLYLDFIGSAEFNKRRRKN
jgi:hypothetical protein